MDAFLFESQCVDFTLPKSVDLTLLKYDDSKLLITKVLPAMGTRSFKPAEWLVELMKKHRVYAKFKTFPALYQRVRGYNLMLAKKRSDAEFDIAFKQFVSQTKQGKMYGNWNDYGRLSL